MPGDTLVESNWAGEFAFVLREDNRVQMAWTKRFTDQQGYTMTDIGLASIGISGDKSSTTSHLTPLKQSEEGRLEAAVHGVGDHRDGDEERGEDRVHARQRVDGGAAAEDEHGRDDEVRGEAEEEERAVRLGPARLDDLAHGVRGGALALDLDGQDAEEEHLDRGAGGVPEGPGDAVVPGDVGRLQQRGRPGPLRHDDGGREARLDGAAGRVKELGRDGARARVCHLEVRENRGEQRHADAHADDDDVARRLR